MSIDAKIVRDVATLARLDLSDADLAVITPQLAAIIDYVDLLARLDTTGVEPLAHPLKFHNVFRPDELAPSLSADEALANAPERHGDFFSVPAVLD